MFLVLIDDALNPEAYFSYRIAIWSHNRWIIGGLVLIICGHWSLILQGVQLKATWVDGVGCVITETNNRILAAIFIYSMCFDLLILSINTYKLLGLSSKAPRVVGTSRLSKMIFEDGLIFFFIAYVPTPFHSVDWLVLMPLSLFQFLRESDCNGIHVAEFEPDHECHLQCPCRCLQYCEFDPRYPYVLRHKLSFDGIFK